jgi:hypothetical protein
VDRVSAVWYRKLTRGDFFHIERRPDAGPTTGGGQTYVDVPNTARAALFRLLGVPERPGHWPTLRVEASVIGDPAISAPLRFEFNRAGETRYRIARQQRQLAGTERHPAWTAAHGFPRAPDAVSGPLEAEQYLPAGGVRLFLVRTEDGTVYAGHASGNTMPTDWPTGLQLERLFATARAAGGIIEYSPQEERPLFDPTNATRPFLSTTGAESPSAGDEGTMPDVELEAGAGGPSVIVTDVESGAVAQFTRRGTVGTVAERREYRLLRQYADSLQARGHTVSAHEYAPAGSAARLRSDAFDETDRDLIEAKGSVTRAAVRMAIGQIADYKRFEAAGTALTVLLPWKPSEDLIDLIRSVGARPVWLSNNEFVAPAEEHD